MGSDRHKNGERGDEPQAPMNPRTGAHDSAADPNQTELDATLDQAQPQDAREAERFHAGTLFDQYELQEEIARGGMGVVYRARHVKLNRTVALKMILSGRLASRDDVRRFFLEAEAAASLDHPGIVPIYEIGNHDGQHFFAMKYIAGGSLVERLEELRKDTRRALDLLVNVARAVHHAHQRGILHRDLKPANILIDESGEPLVSDLGLAKQLRGKADVTNTGAILGTPRYMSPEQASGVSEVTTAADIYSLGAILYQILVGRPPHGGETALQTVMQVLNEKPVQPRDIDRKIDRGLELICMKCLERDPNARYTSAAALADDLEHWLAGEPISVRPLSLGTVLRVWLRDNLRSVGGAVATGLIAGFSLAVVFWMTSMSKPMSVGAGVYERFPGERRPMFAIEPAPAEVVAQLHWVWILTISLTSIGLLNVLLVRPATKTAMIGSGVIAGLFASLVAFVVSVGWGSVFASAVWPVHKDLHDISEAAFAGTAEEIDRGQRALLRRHPDLADVSPAERGNLMFRKVYMDQLTGIPIGLWLGVVGTLIAGLITAVPGTLIAGSLIQKRRRFTMIVLPYLEIMGTASLACLFLVINSVGRLAGLSIIAPPLHYQFPFYASLLLVSVAAYRCWNLPTRAALHIIWIVIAVIYFGEIGRTTRAGQIAADLVEQGRLEAAATRLERQAANQRWEAFPQFGAAVLRARLGHWDRHAAHCRDMIARFERTSDPFEADQTAKACLLSYQPIELDAAVRLADIAVQEGKSTNFAPWFEFVRALAAYRSEEFDLVEDGLTQSAQSDAHFFAATSILLRSMTLRKLARQQEADQTLQLGKQRYEAGLRDDEDRSKRVWLDRMVFEILYEEHIQTDAATVRNQSEPD